VDIVEPVVIVVLTVRLIFCGTSCKK
jgi:hypothetical protein